MISLERSIHVIGLTTRAKQCGVPKQAFKQLLSAGALSFLLATPALAGCPADSVQVGPICMDKYEASVWSIPANKTSLLNKVRNGTATLANLTGTAGVMQLGLGLTDDYPCDDDGNDCTDVIYAVSIPGVKPSGTITWFQAQQACENAGKRLPRNGEWQQAAAGTPDPGTDNDSTDCNTSFDGFPANDPVNTGSRVDCVSNRGVFDMVGNTAEWVEDWVTLATTCADEMFNGTSDTNCLVGADPFSGPAAMIRGGAFSGAATKAGVFYLNGLNEPWNFSASLGFRCAR